jgi:transcriptional antiterminator RfaH
MFQQELLARIIPVTDEALLLRQLADVQKVIESGLEVLRYNQMAEGRRVKVINGPLYGLEGRVENVTSPRGIVISVDVLQKGLLVTVPILQLELLH